MAKIIICGNYGATNIGDEAILEGLLGAIDQNTNEICVLGIDPERVSQEHKTDSQRIFPAGVRSLFKGIFDGSIAMTITKIRRCDLFILGGGGLFTDEKLMAIFIWSIQAFAAFFFRKRLICLGQTVGPLETGLGKFFVKKIYGKSTLNIVRDNESKKVLESLGIKNVMVLPDPAFNIDLAPTHLASHIPHKTEPKKQIVVSLRPWITQDDTRYRLIASFIDWAWQKYEVKTLLVPFQTLKDDDNLVLKKINAFVENKNSVELINYSGNLRHVLEILSQSYATVGMRLHSLILSSLCSTPFLGLSYSNKVRSFASEMGMGQYLMEWENLNLDLYKEKFTQLMANWKIISGEIEKNVTAKKRSAQEYSKYIQQLLK